MKQGPGERVDLGRASATSRSNRRRSLVWESWQSTQSCFATCVLGCIAGEFSWQGEQSLSLGMSRLSVVMSPRVWARWQVVHEITMAAWTNLPLVLEAWHEE